jgi:hypothetical protein
MAAAEPDLRTAFAIVGKPSAATRSARSSSGSPSKFLAEHPTRGAEIAPRSASSRRRSSAAA